MLSVLLAGVEVELQRVGRPIELAALPVFLDLPAVRNERVGVEVDDVLRDDHFGRAGEEALNAFHPAALVDERLDLAEVEVTVLDSHWKLLSGYLPVSFSLPAS